MNCENVLNYIDNFFEDVYYSQKTEQAREKIVQMIIKEYEELLKKNDKTKSFEAIVRKYNSLEKMGTEAGFSKDDIDSWVIKEESADENKFSSEFKRIKKYYLGISLMLVLLFSAIVDTLNFKQLFYLVITILLSFVNVILIRKNNKKNLKKEKYTIDCYEEIRNQYDKYSRKSINCIFIFFVFLAGSLTNIIDLYFNSKGAEFIEYLFMVKGTIIIPLFLIFKNLLITDYLFKHCTLKYSKIYAKELKKLVIGSTLYWLISIIFIFFFQKIFVLNPIVLFELIYVLAMLIYNFKVIKKFTYKRRRYNKVLLTTCSILAVVILGYGFMSKDIWLVQPYINSIPNISESDMKITYDETDGIYTINNNKEEFKILQLTDIHLGGGLLSYDKDKKALEAVYELVSYTKPDLVIVTGDLTFPVGYASFSFNNTAPVMQFASFMRNLGIPWAFTYGNHDTESYAATSTWDLNELYKSMSYKTSKNLLYPYVQPSITGRNNQLIEIRNSDNTLNQALFLIDSNAYTDDGFNKYDYIHDDQVKWYKEKIEELNEKENKNISSLVFFHIPLQEYRTAYKLYEEGSDEVEYYFGSNDEKMFDKVCCSDYPSEMFNAAKELKSTKGFFCGHDHYNNISLEYEGIRLTYGMSIDYLAMPGIARDIKQRGGTLITLHQDSSVDIEQIPLEMVRKEKNKIS